MRFTSVVLVLSFVLLLAAAKTVLLSNDDGWASTYIRAAYRELTNSGYDVIMVAPVSQRSGFGGKFDVPSGKFLDEDGEFGYVKKGAPAWDHEKNDTNMWYFDGTPASCVSFALDYLLPEKFDNVKPDLVIAGPNEGPNLSPGFYTASGTMGAVYNGIYRGIPGLSFLGSDFNNSFFGDALNDSPSSAANIYAKKVVELTDKVVGKLPPNTGLNVNFPKVGSLSAESATCTSPQWRFARMMGSGVFAQSVKYNLQKGTMEWDTHYYNLENKCTGNDCSLESEYDIYVAGNCTASISVFSTDYDASGLAAATVKQLLGM